MSRNRSHRRHPREASSPDEHPPSRSTVTSNVTVALINHGSSSSMARGDALSGGSTARRAAAVLPPSPPEVHWGGQYEAAAGKRRHRGAFAVQGAADSSGTAGKAEDRGSSAVVGSGSGSGPSSSGRAGFGGLSLTEENVRRTSSYYEYMRRDNAGERGESSGRRASLLATLEDAGNKLSGARR